MIVLCCGTIEGDNYDMELLMIFIVLRDAITDINRYIMCSSVPVALA